MDEILTLVEYYLPGYKGGGPIQTVSNMVEQLKEVQFKIVTRDRDLGDTRPYESVRVNEWQRVSAAKVFYASPDRLSLVSLRRLIHKTSYDALYLQSLFSPLFTLQVLLLRKFDMIPKRPLIIAPRGELSPGALALKKAKKQSYLSFARVLKLYNGVIWQASSGEEERDIQRHFGDDARVVVAPNIAQKPRDTLTLRLPKEPGKLKVVFLSRVDRKKNLDGAIKMLKSVQGEVLFNIYGPVSDSAYWQECQTLLQSLPPNVTVRYQGPVGHEKVSETLVNYDLFFLPTHGENYGHAILEALVAGCPVLISDRTPWRDLEEKGVGWELPLENPEGFTRVLQQCVEMGTEAHSRLSAQAREFGMSRSSAPEVVQQNLALFRQALGL